MASILILLTCFHLLFFRKFYFVSPYSYFTSELASTAFPSTVLLGRSLRQAKLPNCHYYLEYAGIPFLSTFYPPHMLLSIVCSYIPLNISYCVYMCGLLLHFIWASLGSYLLFSAYPATIALLAAILLPYSAYCIKQNSSIIYTLAWLPWLILGADNHSIFLMGSAIGATLLAGYWPLGLLNIGLSVVWWISH